MQKNKDCLKVIDTIPGSVSIRRFQPGAWKIKQRVLTGAGQDNAQNPVWVKIENPGRPRKILISIDWADTQWPHFRAYGYLKTGLHYTTIRGRSAATCTFYRPEIPAGISYFGSFPWYANEDAEAFFAGYAGRPECRVRVIGRTAQGRAIKCLTIGRRTLRRRENVMLLARTHANESSGSFAMEGAAKYLLHDPGARPWLKRYVFHLFPNVNPDGIAAGLKLTRIAPDQYKEYNMFVTGMTSSDPTMQALRAEILKLKPTCLLDFHSYLPSVPMAGFLDKHIGAALYDQLFDGIDPEGNQFYLRLWPKLHAGTSLIDYCRKKFNATVIVPELPWNFARLPQDMKNLGAMFVRAALAAHAGRRSHARRPAERRPQSKQKVTRRTV